MAELLRLEVTTLCGIPPDAIFGKHRLTMGRFLIEHLPRAAATYNVRPLDHGEAKAWICQSSFQSLVRTTELIAAIHSGMGIKLEQADGAIALRPGDEAVLISLSYGVLLASAQGNIPPLPEDWRFSLLTVGAPAVPSLTSLADAAEDTPSPHQAETDAR
jgi:hypothetical protein